MYRHKNIMILYLGSRQDVVLGNLEVLFVLIRNFNTLKGRNMWFLRKHYPKINV